MNNDFTADLVLKQIDMERAAFDFPITVTKEMFFDFDRELKFELNGELLENKWAFYFVKEYVSEELINWLRNKEFCVKMVPKGRNNKLTRILHFANEEDRLHYLLKFVSN